MMSDGTADFDLTIMSNTVVRLLKASPVYTPAANMNSVKETTIEDSVKC